MKPLVREASNSDDLVTSALLWAPAAHRAIGSLTPRRWVIDALR